MLRSDRTTRLDVDYQILGSTGLKVPPNPENRNMANNDLKRSAIHVKSDLDDFFDTYDLTTLVEQDEVTVFINELGGLKRNFRRIFSEIKEAEGDDFDTKYPDFEKDLLFYNVKLKDANCKLSSLKMKTKLAEAERNAQIDLEKQKKINGILDCAENLKFEIKVRYDTFHNKCSVNLDNLNDYEILDIKKCEGDRHIELRELIDKVSSFEKFVVPCGNAADGLKKTIHKIRDDSKGELDNFLERLASVIKKRDISEAKLKNSKDLEIKLPEFRGYASDIDIYTFRSEFKKLVEPFLRKPVWATFLKNNALKGPAHSLVAKIDDIDIIWEKLTDSYGDTRTLLQNKLGTLKKFCLIKIKDDEKIAWTINKLLNVMNELQKLAEDYDLKEDLYYGGSIHQILNIIGQERERKFIKSISRGSRLGNPEKWSKLEEFLKNERSEREAYILHEKSKKIILEKSLGEGQKEKKENEEKAFLVQENVIPSHANQCSGNDQFQPKCHICGKFDHVQTIDTDNKKVIEYVACKEFVDKKPSERGKLIYKKRLCGRCLKPGVKYSSDHNCDSKYVCNQPYKKGDQEYKCKHHVLVCGFHCEKNSNKELLEKYKNEVIKRNKNYLDFTKNISLSCFSEAFTANPDNRPDLKEASIYAFQTIMEDHQPLNVFYDNGCGDMIITKDAFERLKRINKAVVIDPTPKILNGVNNQKSTCEHGIVEVSLTLKDGSMTKLSGMCLDEITCPFPKYPLGDVEKDIVVEAKVTNQTVVSKLPRLPAEVGGKVDIMIGKAFLKDFPVEIFRLKSGLTIYESMFYNKDGTTGVVSGPHPRFTAVEIAAHFSSKSSYYTQSAQHYLRFLNISADIPLIGIERSFIDPEFMHQCCNGSVNNETVSTNSTFLSSFHGNVDNKCDFGDLLAGGSGIEIMESSETFLGKRAPKNFKIFNKLENTGITVQYRCGNCRKCEECKRGPIVEEISLKTEYEQHLIDNSVYLDTEQNVCIAHLPFLEDPDMRLENNLKTARKVYDGVVKRLNKSRKDLKDVLEAEGKLQDLGFVEWLDNLPIVDQRMIMDARVRYVIPWRAVWSHSITTPCRPVFDGTMDSAEAPGINKILAKGSNNMNSILEILLRWFIKAYVYHTDITKCYNGVKLHKSHWRFQLYLFEKDLDPEKEPKLKVIKTCIYGLRPSGNQAERAVRLTADTYKPEYPMAHRALHEDLYVDDCVSGEDTEKDRRKVMDELRYCLGKAGFSLKGFTLSGLAPRSDLSSDGKSIDVFGMKWYAEKDFLMLNMSDFSFSRKFRGRKIEKITDLPEKLTLTDCASIVGQIFDPCGKVAPLVAGFKLDLSHLHRIHLKWGDEIPENLRSIWSSNYEMMKEMSHLKWKRAIVPITAKNLKIFTLDASDASPSIACVAIYARFELVDGSFSCQLVLARTKILPLGISTPRAELVAATMSAASGHVVGKSFGKYHDRCIKLTDSTVVLYWISSEDIVLKTWVRERVIEINRLCDKSVWFHIESADNPADLGTRKGAKVEDVCESSPWIKGLPWMSGPEDEFPMKSFRGIQLSHQTIVDAKKESLVTNYFHTIQGAEISNSSDHKISLHYAFSDYLLDPNKYRFRKVIRVFALVLTFIWKIAKILPKVRENRVFKHIPPNGFAQVLKCTHDKYIVTTGLNHDKNTASCLAGQVVELNDKMLVAAMNYFAWKSSQETKHFLKKEKYCNITTEIDGILYYSGRILHDYQFDGYPDLCEAAIDLCSTSFCVPVMSRYSPVAISIALEIHWHHPDVQHRGVEAIFRKTLDIAHIIGGHKLSVSIKKGCKRCRILYKCSVDVAMGPLKNFNFCIAPAFYASQIDIFGPFKAFSPANKRATIKAWFLIFCCCTTNAVDIRVLENYSTDSVVLGYIRHSSCYGYAKYVLPDAGSQLLKSCEDIRYSFTDTKNKLHFEFGVEYTPCPVDAHYDHGKVERKIKEVKKSVLTNVQDNRLSLIQWETLMQQISNSMNNMPIGIRHKRRNLESLDLITPNRLILGRNNERSPNAPLVICPDHKKIIDQNANIFRAWFKAWLIGYLPQLMERPKWHSTGREMLVGDIVLFLKSSGEFDEHYQYGVIKTIYRSKDELVRKVDVEYQNSGESTKRCTNRGVRDLVIVYPIGELDIYEKLYHYLN